MAADKIINTDILVVGGGMGGMVAALKAREAGRDVTLVEKSYVGKAGVSYFAGAEIVLFDPKIHEFDRFMNWVLHIGEYVNNRDWIKTVLDGSAAMYQDLVAWGVPFQDPSIHEISPFSHVTRSQFERFGVATHTAVMTHKKWLMKLRKKAIEIGVKILDRVMMADLVKQDDRVVGGAGFHTVDGDFYLIKAGAVIIATGSGNFKTAGEPWHQWTADGEAMSYRAGAEVTGKEFGHTGISTLKENPTVPYEAARGVSPSVYINGEGEDYLKEYPLQVPGILLSALFEVHAGRGPIYIDFDRVTQAERKEVVEMGEALGVADEMRKAVDYRTEAGRKEIIYGSGIGTTGWGAGGLRVSMKCETALPGLYAVGDSAGTAFCGAARPHGGYGLGGAAITGRIAAENAAEYVLGCQKATIKAPETARLREQVFAPLSRKGGFSPTYVTELLRNLMIPYYIMGVKHGERLEAAINMVNFMGNHLVPRLKANDPHELRMAHEVRNMALDAEIVLRSSLFRTESRGSHYREDYPRRDDENWLAWTVLKDEQGEMRLYKQPIPKEWWPDLSVPYEERYELRFPGE